MEGGSGHFGKYHKKQFFLDGFPNHYQYHQGYEGGSKKEGAGSAPGEPAAQHIQVVVTFNENVCSYFISTQHFIYL